MRKTSKVKTFGDIGFVGCQLDIAGDDSINNRDIKDYCLNHWKFWIEHLPVDYSCDYLVISKDYCFDFYFSKCMNKDMFRYIRCFISPVGAYL